MNTDLEAAEIKSIANIVIPVADQDVALAFYRDQLGLQLRADFPLDPETRWIEVSPEGSTTTIALAVPRGGMWRAVGGDTNVNLACEDAHATHSRLSQAGVDVDQHVLELPGGVPPMFRLRDPFRNILQVVQTPERGNSQTST